MNFRPAVSLAVIVGAACAPVAAVASHSTLTLVQVAAATSDDNTPTFTWTGRAGTRVKWTLSRDGRPIHWGSTRHASITLGPLRDGTYQFAVRDGKRGAAAVSPPFTILSPAAATSRPAPAPAPAPPAAPAPQFRVAPPGLTGDRQPLVAWARRKGCQYRVRVVREGGAPVELPPTTGDSLRIGPLDEGRYSVVLIEEDKSGRVSAPAQTSQFTVDLTPPPAPTFSPGGSLVVSSPPKVAIAAEPGARLRWRISGPSKHSGSDSTADFGRLPDGSYTLSAQAVDPLDRPSPTGTMSVVIDRVAPPAPTIAPIRAVATGPAPTVSWSGGEPDALYRWSIVQGQRTVQIGEGRGTSLTLPDLPDGEYGFVVRQFDAAMNASPGAQVLFQIARPRVALPQSAAPTSGPPPAAAPSTPPARIAGGGRSRGLIVKPFGSVRPAHGLIVSTNRPLLRWRVGPGARPTAYNVQVYAGRRKVHSAFPRTNLYRVPKGIIRPGRRYYWQVWAYRPNAGYGDKPVAISWFRTVRGR